MLRALNIYKNYGAKALPVLQDVSFSIEKGEFCALTGASGSGKTTMMNLFGLLDRPTSGQIHVAGIATDALSSNEAAHLRNSVIGFVFQSFHLLPNYSALDNVALPLLYRGIPGRDRRRRAADALAKVGLSDRSSHRPGELSGGQRQRVAIARALIGSPSVLLADEPTGNLDTASSNDVTSLFMDLNKQFGLTVLIVTHDPALAARCPRRIVMRDGQVWNDITGAPREVLVS